jgi:hypothetical protein
MTDDLTPEERPAVIVGLREKIDNDKYPRAPRLAPALAKLDPASAPKPPPAPRPPLPEAPMRSRGGKRVRR